MNRLPVEIENRELPIDNYNKKNDSSSGYVSIMVLCSILATGILWVTILFII